MELCHLTKPFVVVLMLSLMPLCLSAGFGEDCSSVTQCTDGLVCTELKCVCPSYQTYVVVYAQCFNGTYGGVCTDTANCTGSAQCLDFDGEGNNTAKSCIGAPVNLEEVTLQQALDSTGHVILNVIWKLGAFTGPTKFTIDYEGKDPFGGGPAEVKIVLTGYDPLASDNQHVLRGGWRYKVYVQPITAAGNGAKYLVPEFQAINGKPGLVRNLTVEQSDTMANEMTLSFNCPLWNERNGVITAFVVRKTLTSNGANNATEYPIEYILTKHDCSVEIKETQVGGIVVLNNYTFEVKVKNGDQVGDYSSPVHLSVAARRPMVKALNPGADLLIRHKPADSTANPTSFQVAICAACFMDSTQGLIQSAALLVCQESKSDTCQHDYLKLNDINLISRPSDIGKYNTWATAKDSDFAKYYRATPDNWVAELRNDASHSFIHTVGQEQCNVAQKNVYCNGPVLEDKIYTVTVVVCNEAGCDSVSRHNFNASVRLCTSLSRLLVVALLVMLSWL